MRRADEPAFPQQAPAPLTTSQLTIPSYVPLSGLTKREYAAIHAPITVEDCTLFMKAAGYEGASYESIAKVLAKMQVQYADALIAALAKEPGE